MPEEAEVRIQFQDEDILSAAVSVDWWYGFCAVDDGGDEVVEPTR
jgi:hypothetical protein